MYFALALIVTLLGSSVEGASRSLSRSTQDGNVNLIEFVIDNVMYGRCTYPTIKGDYVTLLFEERESGMKAWSGDSRIDDPLTEAKICRSAASQPSQNNVFSKVRGETDSELKNRIESFQGEMATNQNYESNIKSRIFGNLFGLRGLGSIFQNNARPLTPLGQQLQAIQTPVQAIQASVTPTVQSDPEVSVNSAQVQSAPVPVYPVRQSGVMQPTLNAADQSVISAMQDRPLPLFSLGDVYNRFNTPFANFLHGMGIPTQRVTVNVPKAQLVRDRFPIIAPALRVFNLPYLRLNVPTE